MSAPRTPGPWHYLDIGEVVSSDPVTGMPDASDVICAVAGEDPVADGSLIAAAPELLDALDDAIEFMESVDPDSFTLRDAREVVAKARGDQ